MKVFQVKSTPVRVHWSLLALLAGLMTWQYMTAGIGPAVTIGVAALCVFATVFVHELSHVLVASDFGYDARSITLYPFGGIARIEMPVRVPPKHELYIALAGPLSNAVMALMFLPLAWFYGEPYGLLLLLNFVMFLFNMLPSYPMDGGRVMRSLLARKYGHNKATRFALAISRGFAWIYLIGGVVMYSPLLVMIGAYLLYLLYYRIRKGEEVLGEI